LTEKESKQPKDVSLVHSTERRSWQSLRIKCIQVNNTKIKISFISEGKTMDICIKDFEENISVSFFCFIRQEK